MSDEIKLNGRLCKISDKRNPDTDNIDTLFSIKSNWLSKQQYVETLTLIEKLNKLISSIADEDRIDRTLINYEKDELVGILNFNGSEFKNVWLKNVTTKRRFVLNPETEEREDQFEMTIDFVKDCEAADNIFKIANLNRKEMVEVTEMKRGKEVVKSKKMFVFTDYTFQTKLGK